MSNQIIPDYVITRLRRPANKYVVEGSTPVIAFGNPSKARVGTMGLNPSLREFLDKRGAELVDSDRRLETFRSLGVQSLEHAPADKLLRVVDGCNNYFHRNHNPYRPWFDQLDEYILKPCGASYYDGTACHLDLVQWATRPTWRGLPPNARKSMILEDASFLSEQLGNENIRAVLLNGRSVVNAFIESASVELAEIPPKIMGMTEIFKGHGPNGVEIIGWSTNLQGCHGVSNTLRAAIGRRVKELLSGK